MKIGFIGVGRMGGPMAVNLLKAGFKVTAHDAEPANLRDITDAGGTAAETLPDLGATQVSISMLPDADITAQVLTRLLPHTDAGHVHVAMGTVGVSGVRRLADLVASAGRGFADAPVSGSVGLAHSAQISTMVGAEPEVFERIRPVLAAMTKSQAHVGPVGAGSALKLAVNIVIGANNQAIAEALAFAEAHGINLDTAYDVLGASAAASPYLQYKREEFLHPGALAPTAPVAIVDKDLRLALEAGDEAGLHLPSATALRGVLRDAERMGLYQQDMSRVIDVVRQLSGGRTAAAE